MTVTDQDLEARARAHYEAARKKVSGRPKWERLDPNCPYDMGMRAHAFEQAKLAIASETPPQV